MLQFSVYARVCNGNDAVKKHEGRLRASLPPNGSIRLLVVTEKQYQSIQILLGNYQPEDAPFACEQLSFFSTKSASDRNPMRFLHSHYTIPRAIREL